MINLSPSDNGRDYLLTFTAGDHPGLLASVALVLTRHKVSVLNARINTLGNRAEDVFVLQGEEMGKTAFRLGLEQALLETLRV